MSNSNDTEPFYLRYLRINEQFRLHAVIFISIIGIIITSITIYYFWFSLIPDLWSFGFPATTWWKPVLSVFGCMYLAIFGVVPLGLYEPILKILNLNLQEQESIYFMQHHLKGFDSKKIFIVHGHDEGAKESICRFIEKVGLEAIVLHEQASQGKTIIEKFENHANCVGFALVILTPDDCAYPDKNESNKQYRARQNVILELGYFTASLGRDRVFVLRKDEVEIPSDYMGVVYTTLDPSGAWKMALIKEMKRCNLECNTDNIF